MPRIGRAARWPSGSGSVRLQCNGFGRIWVWQPHRVETFKVSNDPQFEDKLIDVVGLYLNPPEKAIVLCMDEKSQIQALDRTQPSLPMVAGPGGDDDP